MLRRWGKNARFAHALGEETLFIAKEWCLLLPRPGDVILPVGERLSFPSLSTHFSLVVPNSVPPFQNQVGACPLEAGTLSQRSQGPMPMGGFCAFLLGIYGQQCVSSACSEGAPCVRGVLGREAQTELMMSCELPPAGRGHLPEPQNSNRQVSKPEGILKFCFNP